MLRLLHHSTRAGSPLRPLPLHPRFISRSSPSLSHQFNNPDMSSNKKYIVVFKESATQEEIDKYANDVDSSGNGKVTQKYGAVLKGFAAELSPSFKSSLESNLVSGPIEYIEEDSVVTTQQ